MTKNIWMIIKYIPAALIVFGAKIICFPLALLVCWFPRFAEENEVTGYTSKYPGKPRAFLRWPVMWMQTHDDCLDAYWHSSKSNWLREKGFTQEYFDTHKWFRVYNYCLWIWRNPAYGLANAIGFIQWEVEYLSDDDPIDVRWDSGQPCRLLRVVENKLGQRSFLYRSRGKLEIVLGYKVPWDGSPRAMLAIRIKPNWKKAKSQ